MQMGQNCFYIWIFRTIFIEVLKFFCILNEWNVWGAIHLNSQWGDTIHGMAMNVFNVPQIGITAYSV